MLNELRPHFGKDAAAGDEMFKAVTSGERPLTRELFMKVVSAYVPSKKDEIIRSLDSWDANIQKKQAG